jgi:hypothetical protein
LNGTQQDTRELEAPRILLLTGLNLSRWAAHDAVQKQPGGEMPYGMQALAPGYRLTWTDAAHSDSGPARAARLADRLVGRLSPGLRGLPDAAFAMKAVRRADGVVSIFEDSGLAFARLSPAMFRRRPAPSHVMVCCWLSEDCTSMSERALRSVRRSLASVARIVVFSSNQVAILERSFSIPRDRIAVVPFGVDTSYYDSSKVGLRPGGGGVVAVGSDSRRDYATLFEAARITAIPMTVSCQARNIEGLTVPSQVRIVSVYGPEYRRLLHSADLVVTPTVGPAYPSGQSVVLEAMSMARPTLTTDSVAMREYVTDDWDGALMPVRDPVAVADRLAGLMADPARREAMALRGAESVRERFDSRHMWTAIGSALEAVVR